MNVMAWQNFQRLKTYREAQEDVMTCQLQFSLLLHNFETCPEMGFVQQHSSLVKPHAFRLEQLKLRLLVDSTRRFVLLPFESSYVLHRCQLLFWLNCISW